MWSPNSREWCYNNCNKLILTAKGDTELSTIVPAAAWPGEALLPPLVQTTSLEIYDVRAASPDRLLSLATLVGLLNRGPAKVYLIENGDDEFWLQQLDPALPCTRSAVVGDEVLDHLLRNYREQIAGLVIYDPALLDTRNVASTLAALRAGLAVSPELVSALQESPYGLPVLADLRTYGWKNRIQAYLWAANHLLPECSSDLLAGLDPGICGSLRSFLVTQRVFTCWLDARRILPSPAAGWHCERGLFKRVLANFRPGAVHLGWFISEPFSIRLTSRAAILTLASDHCTNLAVWSTLPGAHEIPTRTVTEEAQEALDAHATYLSFTISDGDNLQYCQHHLLHLWRDPARGRLPLGWTIAPALWQTMPRLAEFYRQSATENDNLIAGPSGVAYILPSYWPRKQRAAFLQMTAAALQAVDLTLLQVLDSRTWLSWFSMKFLNPGLQELFATQLAAGGLRGILSGAGSFFPSWSQRAGLPIYQNLGLALNPERTLSLIQSARARGIRFINVYIFAWNINPGDLQRIVEQLDGDIRVVTPARLLEFIRQTKS